MQDSSRGKIVSPTTVAFFCMNSIGHFRRCRSLIEAVAEHGIEAVVFTDAAFEAEVREAGARFEDLFNGRPLSAADDSSVPNSCRYVTFAGRFGDAVIEDVRQSAPQLVITDSFAVVGRVVAGALNVPYVNVCSGHNVLPARFRPLMAAQVDVLISDACLRAVETLRDRFGLPDASPFAQVAPPSPDLNVYCEPPQFLTRAEREAFEPVEFFGSLPSDCRASEMEADGLDAFPCEADRKIYISFGTIAWRYFARQAIDALKSIATVIGDSPRTCGLISLGGHSVDPEVLRDLERPNVRVERYVDQWQVLSAADAFVTHHGLNSTHEAIFHRVPMVSYPFWWDQPELAERCQALDLAVALAREPLSPIHADEVRAAFEELAGQSQQLEAGLARARSWEDEVMGNRRAVVRRIAELASD